MSSAFVELGLLVLAAFALGLLVGWLAWAGGPIGSTEAEPERDHTGPPPTNEDLPEWTGRSLPSVAGGPEVDRTTGADADQTVAIRPRGWAAGRKLIGPPSPVGQATQP